MHLFVPLLAGAAATTGLMLTPVGSIYPNCTAARAAGAAPLYAGQPGYGRKLDLDGDGIACERRGSERSETSGSSAPGVRRLAIAGTPSAAIPSVQAPAVPATGRRSYTTIVRWTGTDCIHITAPTGTPGALQTSAHCGGHATLFSSGVGDELVGADPILGDAASVACEILGGRSMDSGTAGDGHDVKCLTPASTLP